MSEEILNPYKYFLVFLFGFLVFFWICSVQYCLTLFRVRIIKLIKLNEINF